MSTAELNSIKLNLIAWINQLSDADLIGFLDGLRISMAKTDWWEGLTSYQQREILAGLKDAEAGKVMDSTKFWGNLKNG